MTNIVCDGCGVRVGSLSYEVRAVFRTLHKPTTDSGGFVTVLEKSDSQWYCPECWDKMKAVSLKEAE